MGYDDRDGVIWMDGALVPWREARVHVLTHTLHYGTGVFEGIRAYRTPRGTAVFRLPEHIRRLYDSAKILRIDIPYDVDTVTRACLDVVRENDLPEAYIRPLVYLGTEGVGLRADNLTVHVAIAAWSWGAYLGDDGLENGIRIRTSSYTRHHVNATMCKAKAVGNYTNSILALREAIDSGCDEALLLDPEGFVAEGSGENLFIVRDGIVYTPELASVLPGITRDAVIRIARHAGLEVVEKRITRDEVYIADEAWFTGTAAEITPIREYDGRAIGAEVPGPITRRLRDLFFAQVRGEDDTFSDWLTLL